MTIEKNMKMHRLYGLAGVSLLLLASLAYIGCDINAAKEAFDKFDVIIELDPINTTVGGLIVDASTENFVTRDIRLRFAGDDAAAIIDMFSDPLSEVTVSEGVTGFGIQNAVVPSEGSPVQIRVIAEADGYEQGVANLEIKSTGTHSFQIRLIEENRVPQGAATVNSPDVQVDQSGAVTSTVTVQTPPTQTQSQTQVAVTVPAGTVMQDAAGNPLTGTINTEVTFFSAEDEQSLAAIPGGGGQLTGGYFKLKVTDSSGKEATHFSKDVDIVITSDGGGAGLAKGLGTTNVVDFTIDYWDDGTADWIQLGSYNCDPLVNIGGTDACSIDFTAATTGIFSLSVATASLQTCTPSWTFTDNGNTGTFQVVASSAADFTSNTGVPSYGYLWMGDLTINGSPQLFSPPSSVPNLESTFGSGANVNYVYNIAVIKNGEVYSSQTSGTNLCTATIMLTAPPANTNDVIVTAVPDCPTQTCTVGGHDNPEVISPIKIDAPTSGTLPGVTIFYKLASASDVDAVALVYSLYSESAPPPGFPYCDAPATDRILGIQATFTNVSHPEVYTAFAIANNGMWRLSDVSSATGVTIEANDILSGLKSVTIALNPAQQSDYCAETGN